ncbi:MAG: hypothetical protein H3C31_07035 [Brumimicrobium sp.]|nr:hypothetical protein [Brumimicrobium sp.]
MKNIIYIFLVLIVLSGCEQQVKTITEVKENPKDTTELMDPFIHYENAKKMAYLDERATSMTRIESLSWERQTPEYGSEFTQIEAFLDENGNPIKINEYFRDGEGQPEGTRIYYLENNKIIAFLEKKDIWVDEYNTQYIEKRTVFENGESVLTQERSSSYYESIQDSIWKKIPTESHSLEKVEQILSGTGRFQTHFISIVKGDQLFLLLGENKPETMNRYTTAVMVEQKTPFIEDLLKNLDKYKFRPVNISFKVIGGNDQPEFRVLTDISWKK